MACSAVFRESVHTCRSLPVVQPVEERLESHAAERQRKLKQLEQMHLAKEEREMTFQPRINEYAAFPVRSAVV